MTSRYLTRLLALFAFVISFHGLSGQAHAAGFMVVIDCHGTGGNPSWSHTASTIAVEARINRANNSLGTFTVPASKCDSDGEIRLSFPSFSARDVVQVLVSTSGNDAFWIDRVELYDAGTGSFDQGGVITLPVLRWRWGSHDNFGFCLSTDAGDGANSYCVDTTAYRRWNFNTDF